MASHGFRNPRAHGPNSSKKPAPKGNPKAKGPNSMYRDRGGEIDCATRSSKRC